MKKIMVVSQKIKSESLENESKTFVLKPKTEIDGEAKLSMKMVESNGSVFKLLGFELDLGDIVTVEIREGSEQTRLDIEGTKEKKKVPPDPPKKEKKGKGEKK
ncbi:hypothetical protein KAR91_41810 [Candidatus Pacearchaeota archaeon]|nr:hypothetical protein [Candidatus Pacearchaeota archaeon]